MRLFGRLQIRHAVVAIGFALIAVLVPAFHAAADLLEVVPCPNPMGCGTFAFRDQRTPNTIGLVVGDRISLGAEVRPNPGPDNANVTGRDTRVVATQGSATANAQYIFSPALPNQYFTSVPYDPGLTGAWTLTITNPTSANSPLVVQTTAVGINTPGLPFVKSMTLDPGPAPRQPTFTWTLPPPGSFTSAAIIIFDLDDRTPTGAARLIHTVANLPLTTSSYEVPPMLNGGGSLQLGTNYAVAIQLDQRRANGSLLSRSRSIFNFQPLPAGMPAVALPSVGPDGVYHFDVAVVAGQTVFIDPIVAVGYDYAIGSGDPRFASVTLPAGIGDDVYDLLLFDATGQPYHVARLNAGVAFEFAALGFGEGVDRFRIVGIEPSAGLDPTDVTAFVTGLTFVADGVFTGTMTPITRDVTGPILTALGPAEVWVGLKNSDDVGANFDLKAEVYLSGTLIGSGQLDAVAGGGSGFNNARHHSIPLALDVPPADAPTGTVLSLKLLARIACSGKAHASGTARAWFNDAQAASRFSAAIDEVEADYHLRASSVLASTPGSGPRTAIDRFLDSKVPCSREGGRPFTAFGTWSIALP